MLTPRILSPRAFFALSGPSSFGRALALATAFGLLSFGGCVEPREAPAVELPVVVDRSAMLERENDLGYKIKLTRARVAVRNIVFAVGGEEHGKDANKPSSPTQANWRAQTVGQIHDWIFPRAHAHPGHFEGGEVTGELKGRFVLDYVDQDGAGPQEIGVALLLYGDYTNANFLLGVGSEEDGLKEGDPLFGHTAVLEGVAAKDGKEIPFEAVIDSTDGREVLGIPFSLKVDAASAQKLLGFRLRTFDQIDEDSMFNGVDFGAIKADANGKVRIFAGMEDKAGKRAYTRIRRNFQTQAQFDVLAADGKG